MWLIFQSQYSQPESLFPSNLWLCSNLGQCSCLNLGHGLNNWKFCYFLSIISPTFFNRKARVHFAHMSNMTSPSSHQRQEEEVWLMHDNVWEIKVLKLHSLWRLQRISDRTENSRAILDADPLCVQTRDRLSAVKEAVACCPHKCQNPIHTLDSEHMGPPACTLIWSLGL